MGPRVDDGRLVRTVATLTDNPEEDAAGRSVGGDHVAKITEEGAPDALDRMGPHYQMPESLIEQAELD